MIYFNCSKKIKQRIILTCFSLVIVQEHNPLQTVRVFTYLIGRDVNELAAAKWIACENKGDIVTSNSVRKYKLYLHRLLCPCDHNGWGEGASPEIYSRDGQTSCSLQKGSSSQVDWSLCWHWGSKSEEPLGHWNQEAFAKKKNKSKFLIDWCWKLK